jgi:hypothetical protein
MMFESEKREGPNDAENPAEETTDYGEGERGVTTPGRGGTFRSTPGEGGDREGKSGGPGTPIPHLQED